MIGLDDSHFPENKNVILTNYGRTAFEKILQMQDLSGSTVAFPALQWNDMFENLIDRYDLEPVFVDVDSRSYHMNVEHVNDVIEDIDVVILNHTFGVPADVRAWRTIADRDDVTLIEDCARGLGASIEGHPVGSFGDFAIYSLKKVSPAVRGGAPAGQFEPSTVDLEPPVYDIKNVYLLLPNRIESRAIKLYKNVTSNNSSGDGEKGGGSNIHPLSPDLREPDAINQLVFFTICSTDSDGE